MLPARALYFVYYAACAALLPYLTLYYESAGLTGAQIGLLVGLMPLVTMIGAPLWTEFADASGRFRGVLWAALGVSLLAAVGLSQAGSFAAFALLVALFALGIAPIAPLVDHAVLEALGERAHEYGRQRVWGAYGWAASAPLVGWMGERYGLPWIFWVYALVIVLALAITTRLPAPATAAGGRFGRGLATMIRDRRWLTFLFAAFAGGVGLSLSLNFLSLHMRELGADLTLIGVAVTAATISELPVMAFGGALLVRFGARRMLVLAMAAWSVRLGLYPLVTHPVWMVPIQLLHGVSFAALWIAGVSYARSLAPRGSGAAAQGLFAAVSVGLGGLLGGVFGGIVYGGLGARWLFGLAAGLAALAGVLLIWTAREPASAGSTTSRTENREER